MRSVDALSWTLLWVGLAGATRMVPHAAHGLLDVVKEMEMPEQTPRTKERGASFALQQQHQEPQDVGSFDTVARTALDSIAKAAFAQCVEDESGVAYGCLEGCQCGWGQQCYPKWVSKGDLPETSNHSSAPGDKVNRGICETSISILAMMSFMLFSLVLTAFVALRTFLQWRALEESAEAPILFKTAILGPTSATSTSFGLSAEQSAKRADKATGPTPGGSAESDTDDKDTDDEHSLQSNDDAEPNAASQKAPPQRDAVVSDAVEVASKEPVEPAA